MTEPDRFNQIAEDFVDEQSWAVYLPEADRQGFVTEAAAALRACEVSGDRSAFLELVSDWRETAAIWSDPALVDSLRQHPAKPKDQGPAGP